MQTPLETPLDILPVYQAAHSLAAYFNEISSASLAIFDVTE